MYVRVHPKSGPRSVEKSTRPSSGRVNRDGSASTRLSGWRDRPLQEDHVRPSPMRRACPYCCIVLRRSGSTRRDTISFAPRCASDCLSRSANQFPGRLSLVQYLSHDLAPFSEELGAIVGGANTVALAVGQASITFAVGGESPASQQVSRPTCPHTVASFPAAPADTRPGCRPRAHRCARSAPTDAQSHQTGNRTH